MSDERRVVGLIGLGQMGGAMCRTLIRGRWQVVAWDIARRAVDAAAAAGAQVAADPADVATRTSVILTSLPDAAVLRAVAFGEHGLVAGMCEGRVVVDTSTISPTDARGIAADFARHGVDFLDAPVSGGVGGAESGQLAIMLGGPAEQVERVRPVLSSIGRAVVHCGPVGAGEIAKACNQLVVMTSLEAVAEALVLAGASGLDPWRVREALLMGFAASPILEIQGERMLRHNFAPGGRAIYHLKDIDTITDLASKAGVSLPGFAVVAQQMERLVAAGRGDLDHSAVITVVEPPSAPP